MARINLLPWREAERAQRKRDFGIMAGVALGVGLGIWFAIHSLLDSAIAQQQARNQYLEQEIQALDRKIREVQELEATKARLLARMRVIQDLQQNRPTSVHLMDQLVRTLPDGVHLNSVRQTEDRLELNGVAESNARVSAYMRNIDSSDWLTSPNLTVIETQTANDRRLARFTLGAVQTQPLATNGSAEDSQ